MPLSNLDLVAACDVFPYAQVDPQAWRDRIDHYVHFRISARPDVTLGYMLPSVALTFANLPDWRLDVDSVPKVLLLASGEDEASRSAVMEKTALAMKHTGHFEILTKWRDELYPVYGPSRELLLKLERAASQLFGVVTYGVHMTAFRWNTDNDPEGLMEIWVPRRSATKQTFPGMLDNSVAGGVSAGESPWTSLMRESMEEASLEESVAKNAKEVGVVTYFYVSGEGSGGESGLLQPECQYVYDLDLTGMPDDALRPNDSEVETFHLWDVARVKRALAEGEFKPNCACVTLDFLIRHGQLSIEEEPDYIEIISRLHRRLEFPLR
jgi:isopentenyldiphosphate isomerase